MTSERSYEQELTKAIQEYKNTMSNTPAVKAMNICRRNIPSSLRGLQQFKADVFNIQVELNKIIPPSPFTFDPSSSVINHYNEMDKQAAQQRQSIRKAAEQRKVSLTEEHAAKEREAESYNQSLLAPIQKKHEELLGYKNELSYVFDHYGISPLDMDISDEISIEEFEVLVDSSIAACIKYSKTENKLFTKALQPLKGETNLAFTASYVLIALVLLYFAMPLFAPIAFVVLFISVHGMYKDMEKLKIARSLMSQIDYQRFVPEDKRMTVDELDTSSVDDDMEKQLQSVKDYSNEREEALKQIASDADYIKRRCEEATGEVTKLYANCLEECTNKLKEIDAAIVNYSKAKLAIYNKQFKHHRAFPYNQSNQLVMSHKYTLGSWSGRNVITAELPLANLVFNFPDRTDALNQIKLYLANALLSVQVKQLTVEIFDPKNMCEDFTEFFTNETKPYIKPNDMELKKLMDTYKEYVQQNTIKLDRITIDDFNLDAQQRELVSKPYKLLIMISEWEDLAGDKNVDTFKEFLKFSAKKGVMVWLLDNRDWPGTVRIDGTYTLPGTPIVYTPELGKEAVSVYVNSLANYKDKGIDYVEKFGNKFIPRFKWWTFDTIKGINMPYGLEDGDPTRGLNVCPVIGDANVHALLGGATGAGKSAAINQLLISLITMYPPSELQIVYIDFKNVEAAKFTAGYDKIDGKWLDKAYEKELREKGEFYTRLSRIPQLRIISGTTDGEYALSVFEFLMAEMARRQQIINKFGVTKVQEMREQILAGYNEMRNGNKKKGTWAEMRKDWDWYKPNVYDKYGDLPRLLVIFDEFQVMYNPEFVESRIIDQINGKITAITKLARAMGSHFWFTSQSMKGTMPKDTIANFSLRGALRCTADVSNELLGNGAASTITAKFGFMYTNDSAGENKDANRLWRVPFLDEKAMPGYINILNDMLGPFNEKHAMAEFYDEKILVPSTTLDEWYNTNGEAFADPSIFILGERANFSTNKAPITFSLMDDTGENVMMAAFDRMDMLNLTMTMVDNCLHKDKDCTILMNVQDQDTYTMMEVEKLVKPQFLEMASPKYDILQLIDNLEAMISSREQRGGPYSRVYMFCVQWERAPGLSVDVNYKLSDKFKDMLRRAPSVGIHFIFSCKERLDMPRAYPSMCNHRICGLMPKDSMHFINTPKVEKLPDATKDAGLFAIYEFGTTLEKFRIYQHVFSKQVASRAVVL